MILTSKLESMNKIKEFNKWLNNWKRNKYRGKR